MEEKDLKVLKDKIGKCKEAVKTAKVNLKETTDEYSKDSREKVLKSAKTKLKSAKAAYKATKPKSAIRQKASAAKESIKDTARKIPVKKALSWTGLAVATVVTTVGGWILYDYLTKDSDGAEADSM